MLMLQDMLEEFIGQEVLDLEMEVIQALMGEVLDTEVLEELRIMASQGVLHMETGRIHLTLEAEEGDAITAQHLTEEVMVEELFTLVQQEILY